MPIKSPQKSPKMFFTLSLLVLCLDLSFVAMTFYQSKSALLANFDREAKNQQTTFQALFHETTANMLQIATFVAHDPRIQQAFLKGNRAVESEGGGPGKQQASLAREGLLNIVAASWEEISKQFKARQLHFHLGPGSVSFLRVHKPNKFGDRMDDVRYTIVDANKYLHSTSGFETGRVYSGIRGVVPVFAIDAKTDKKIHVGAVESGTSYHDMIKNMAKTLNINIVVLLSMEHIQQNVWPDFLEKRLQKTPPFGDFVVEETTSPEFRHIIEQLKYPSLIRDYFSSDKVSSHYINKRFYTVSEMPLRDYRGELNPELKDAGDIVFWKDTTESYNSFFSSVKTNLLYAALGFVLFELLLYFGLCKTTKSLNKIISQKTAQLSEEIALKDAKALELRKFSFAVQQSPSAIIMTNKSGIIEYVNKKFTDFTGFTYKEAIGQSPTLLSSGLVAPATYTQMWEVLLAGKEWQGEFHNRKKNGDLYWARELIAPIFDDAGEITHYIALQDDVTEQRRMSEDIHYQVSHDLLTGLINRREFEQRLDRLIQSAQKNKTDHAFCFFDLDKFKIVNDTSGHPAGDELLRQISTLTKNNIRERDTLARFGGDEFGILMESCSLEKAGHVAEKIRKLIEHFVFTWEGHSFSVGISVGIVAINAKTKDISEAFTQADAACYAAKGGGRNRIQIYQESSHDLLMRKNELDWANETILAIQGSRLALFAQVVKPISDQAKGNLSYEILVRQFAADGSVILPEQFLPALERYNLMVKLDAWVIDASFHFLQSRAKQITEIDYFSINLSSQSLANQEIYDLIVQHLDAHLVPAEKLVFEITEAVAIANMSEATQFINALKLKGCRFALDSYGNGASSFSYLKELPIDFLKIDGLLVKGIANDPIDYAMVKSINEVGQLMELGIIAKFVENDDILQKLKAIHVACAQGHEIGKPQPLSDFFNA